VNRRAWILLLTLSAIWGASYMLIKIGIRDFSPGMVAFLRVALAAGILLAIAGGRGALGGFRDRIWIVALLALVQVAGPFLLINAGEQEISSSLAGILVTSTPLFTALLAMRFDHEERSEGSRLLGVALGVAGVVVLLGVDLGGSGDALLGGLAVVLAGLGYAIGGLVGKHQMSDRPPIGVAAWVLTGSTLILLPVAVLGLPDSAPGLGPVGAVSLLGVLGTGFAFVILYELFATIGPSRAWTVTYLAPGFAVVYGAVLLDEKITAITLIGLALILAGSYLAAEGGTRLRRWFGSGEPAEAAGGPVPVRAELVGERVEGR
jgi:drug/metabolite transporter (DMT)-like permease